MLSFFYYCCFFTLFIHKVVHDSPITIFQSPEALELSNFCGLHVVCPTKAHVLETWSQCGSAGVLETLGSRAEWKVISSWGFTFMNRLLIVPQSGLALTKDH
jgi:hypothetical protein